MPFPFSHSLNPSLISSNLNLQKMSSTGETQLTPTQVSDEEANLFAMQLTTASVPAMVLKAAIELDLLEIIAKAGPGAFVSPVDIASKLPTKNPDASVMLDRILRLLASYSIVSYSLRSLPDGKVERLYGLAPVCKYLTKNEDGVSLAAISLVSQDKVHMESWYYLKDAVLEGDIPFNKAHVMTYDYQGKDLRFNKVFNEGMSNHSTITLKKLLETYTGFEGLTSIVDVGGGIGASLNMIISKYPSIKGINFDLAHVIEYAPSYPGVEHVGGDMFVSVPKADAIFMKWICHNWSDEHCLKFLKNCYDALPENGRVIIVECILPEAPDTSLASKLVIHIDAIMLAHHPGGKERTEKEFEALANGAGFQGFRVACCAVGTYVMEFLKKP